LKFLLSYDQRIIWSEPFRFARARARNQSGEAGLFTAAIFTIAFAVVLCVRYLPENWKDVGVIALFALFAGFLCGYPLMWLLARIPNTIYLTDERIVYGRDSVTFFEVEWAIVGTMRLDGEDYPVLTFRTRKGVHETFGLSDKVDAHALADYLERHTVEVR